MGGMLRLIPSEIIAVRDEYLDHGACQLDFEKVIAVEDIAYPLLIEKQNMDREREKPKK